MSAQHGPLITLMAKRNLGWIDKKGLLIRIILSEKYKL